MFSIQFLGIVSACDGNADRHNAPADDAIICCPCDGEPHELVKNHFSSGLIQPVHARMKRTLPMPELLKLTMIHVYI